MSAGRQCRYSALPSRVVFIRSSVQHQSLCWAFCASSSFSRALMPSLSPWAYRSVRFSMAAKGAQLLGYTMSASRKASAMEFTRRNVPPDFSAFAAATVSTSGMTS